MYTDMHFCFWTFNFVFVVTFCSKAHYVLDEIVMGGMVLETNLNDILLAVNSANKYERASREQPKRASIVKK